MGESVGSVVDDAMGTSVSVSVGLDVRDAVV